MQSTINVNKILLNNCLKVEFPCHESSFEGTQFDKHALGGLGVATIACQWPLYTPQSKGYHLGPNWATQKVEDTPKRDTYCGKMTGNVKGLNPMASKDFSSSNPSKGAPVKAVLSKL